MRVQSDLGGVRCRPASWSRPTARGRRTGRPHAVEACCVTTILESRDRSISPCMRPAHQKCVANQAFAHLAARQGSIWQDVRLIYLTHSHLKLRTHSVSGDSTRRHYNVHQDSDRSGHRSRNRFGCAGGDQAEQQQSQLERERLPGRACRLES
jgi:hypothetical protein